jgi:nifR3 family TIM-barrel protein
MNLKLAGMLNRPLRIGNTSIERRLVLAPMAFLGNVAFRELVQNYGGCGLMFSEMCSAKKIPGENRHRSTYFRWRDDEVAHLVCQIFGDDPHTLAAAARRIEEAHFFGVDINFGCAEVSICRQNCGAAILNDPDLAARIVGEVRRAVTIPLFVKYRIGWEDNPGESIALAKRFEDAGADALTFHPRMAPDRRARPPKWEYIGKVKQAVSIPVFGNGNVFDASDCLKMLETTGCDGVAIGRMALARPWLFAEWTEGYCAEPEIYLKSALRLAALLEKHFEPRGALRRFKKFGYYYSANFKFGHTLFSGIQNAENMENAIAVLHHFFETAPENVSRPNLNFFS